MHSRAENLGAAPTNWELPSAISSGSALTVDDRRDTKASELVRMSSHSAHTQNTMILSLKLSQRLGFLRDSYLLQPYHHHPGGATSVTLRALVKFDATPQDCDVSSLHEEGPLTRSGSSRPSTSLPPASRKTMLALLRPRATLLPGYKRACNPSSAPPRGSTAA